MVSIMRSAFAIALGFAAVVNAQPPAGGLPSLSPFPSPLPPFDNGAAPPPMLPISQPNMPVGEPPVNPPVAIPPPNPVDPMMPAPSLEPMMPAPSLEPMPVPTNMMMMAGESPMYSPDYLLPGSPEPSAGLFVLEPSPGVTMVPYSPEPSMGDIYVTMEPSMPAIAVPVRTPTVAVPRVSRCPNTCRLSVGANAAFSIDTPQDQTFSVAISGPNFATALEVGEALVDGRPVSTYGLPSTTFGIWPIGLTNKFGIGHRTVEVRDRSKLYNRCVTLPITRYITGTVNPQLVNSMNPSVDCVSFYLTPKAPAPAPVV